MRIGNEKTEHKVSIIIPTYNSASYICEAVDSALCQDYENIEIIVVDDGSKDNTRKLLSPYGTRIRYVYQENNGVSSARNTGIKMSTGQYIAFLDSDDRFTPGKIRMQMDFLHHNPDFSMVYTDLSIFKSQELLFQSYHAKNKMVGASGNIFNELLLQNMIHTITVLVKKEVFDRVGVFDEALETGEDYEMWLRISLNFKIGFIPQQLALYRIGHDSLTNFNAGYIDKRFWREPVRVRIIEQYVKENRTAMTISQRGLRKRFFEIYFDEGWFFFKKRNYPLAARCFKKTIYYRPMFLKAYLYVLACSILYLFYSTRKK